MSDRTHLGDYLAHIQQAALDACSFVEGMSRNEFLTDKRTQNAVVMSLVIMGEASAKVMDLHSAFAQRHSEIPWRSMRGMRNRIAHGYFEINFELVWDTVQTALPALLAHFRALPEGDTGRASAIDPPH
jgi:uncharacterized protein with HEPN domain